VIGTIGVNALFLQGDFSEITAAGAVEGGLSPQNIFFLSDKEEGIVYLKKHLKKGDWILVKGSRRMKMERITAQICEDFGSDESAEIIKRFMNQEWKLNRIGLPFIISFTYYVFIFNVFRYITFRTILRQSPRF